MSVATRAATSDAYRHDMIARVTRSPEAALDWLERVGCWQSDDPTTRAITAAAERTMRWR